MPATLSLDLDNEWSYLRVRGDARWRSHPSYIPRLIDLVLPILDRLNVSITFFVVGRDAEIDAHRAALEEVARRGHEIGNHSHEHEPWLHLYAEKDLAAEIERSTAALRNATGRSPVGFRGPGFSVSPAVLHVLSRAGYVYDASTLPTFIGPLARLYYLRTAPVAGEERAKRARLFGRFSDGWRPLRPYRWRLGPRTILELPVTTVPLLRIPFHVSYLLFLARRSHLVATLYFRFALRLCRIRRVSPSLLLHPLDFLGGDEVPSLRFFPAMDLPGDRKRQWVSAWLDAYVRDFDVLPLGRFAEELSGAELPEFPPGSTASPPIS
ncbi:MAG: polysaccharide deacetylase [Acidobacteria bacterium]|nr:MAG: polysaccharide deacetylase [Acidobacteriota bacterium]